MNEQKRPPVGNRGGASRPLQRDSRGAEMKRNAPAPKRPMPKGAEGERKRPNDGWVLPDKRPGPGPQVNRQSHSYTQMPLRPMASMPKDRPYQNQRPIKSERPAPQRPAPQRPAAQQRSAPSHMPRRPEQGRPQAQRPPQAQNQRPQQSPKPQGRTQQPPKKPQNQRYQSFGWVVPEGSPVYTAEGRMYEPQRRPEGQAARGPKQPQRNQGHQGRPGGPVRPQERSERAQGRRPDPRAEQRRRPAPERRQKKKRFNKEKLFHGIKTFFVRLLTLLIVFAILGAWWYRSEFYSDTDARRGSVSYSMKGVGSFEAKAKTAYKNDILYVDFTNMAQWIGMVSVGSVNSMRFICTDGVSDTSAGQGGEEYAIFTAGSAVALINGTLVDLEGASRTVDSHIWVPLSFVENYVDGIVCERNAAGDEIVFVFESDLETEGKDDKKKDEEERPIEEKLSEISFKVKDQRPLSIVEYPS